MKSIFKYWAYFLAVLALFFSVLLILTLSNKVLNPTMPLAFFLLFSLFFIYVWLSLIFGELRTKVIFVEIKYDSFNIKRYLGFGVSKTYYFNQIDGYKISVLSSQSGSYEYLYLMIDSKKIVKLSEFYHKNYSQLKQLIITKNVKDLGFERFSLFREVKEIFI